MTSLEELYQNLGPFEERPDDDVIVCRCEEITKGEIRRAIHMGLLTPNEIKHFLRAGMGLCQGQTCGKHVRGLIASELGVKPSEVGMTTARAPIRPVIVGTYAKDTYETDCLEEKEHA